MARQRPQQHRQPEVQTSAPAVSPPLPVYQRAEIEADAALPPSAEDYEAELDAAPIAEAQPATLDLPNEDLTPPPVCQDPLWEVSCPEHGLPRLRVQAPTAEVAEERYRQQLRVRRPRLTVRKME